MSACRMQSSPFNCCHGTVCRAHAVACIEGRPGNRSCQGSNGVLCLQAYLSDWAALWHQSLAGPSPDPAKILELHFHFVVQINCSSAGKGTLSSACEHVRGTSCLHQLSARKPNPWCFSRCTICSQLCCSSSESVRTASLSAWTDWCRPFFLPCLAVASLSVMATISSIFLLQETLPRIVAEKQSQGDKGARYHKLKGELQSFQGISLRERVATCEVAWQHLPIVRCGAGRPFVNIHDACKCSILVPSCMLKI